MTEKNNTVYTVQLPYIIYPNYNWSLTSDR